MTDLLVRPGRDDDLPRLTEIYNHWVEHSIVTFDVDPFTVEERRTELFAVLAGQGLHRAYAGVALPNDASIRLHLQSGFRELGTYREVGRKLGRWVDVRWFERPMP